MLSFLFRGLTEDRQRGRLLFDWITTVVRQPHWYIEGQVPDTLDGRFAVLATIGAMVLARLEQEGSSGDLVSVALTERFIAVMESEHRELGLGDPSLGKTVRKLVGILASRTDLWRDAGERGSSFVEATRESLYRNPVNPEPLRHSAEVLSMLHSTLQRTCLDEIEQGKIP